MTKLEAECLMHHLASACDALDDAGEHAIAAHVSLAIDRLAERYDVPTPDGDEARPATSPERS